MNYRLQCGGTASSRATARIAVIGGGPGGLHFAALAKQLNSAHQVTVWERSAPDGTSGFGVVFSDAGRCRDLGVALHFCTEAPDVGELPASRTT